MWGWAEKLFLVNDEVYVGSSQSLGAFGAEGLVLKENVNNVIFFVTLQIIKLSWLKPTHREYMLFICEYLSPVLFQIMAIRFNY